MVFIIHISGLILQSTDRRMAPFLDILIECELKQVISNSAVQQYAGMLPKYAAICLSTAIEIWNDVYIYS